MQNWCCFLVDLIMTTSIKQQLTGGRELQVTLFFPECCSEMLDISICSCMDNQTAVWDVDNIYQVWRVIRPVTARW